MPTEQSHAPPREAGFTLIEVLIAMVILAVGLMGLEALGIGAARSVAFAQRQSQFTVDASAEMERAVQAIRGGATAVESSCRKVAGNDQLSVVFINTNQLLPQVTVTYSPDPNRRPTPPAVVLTGAVYAPQRVSSVSGSGVCAS